MKTFPAILASLAALSLAGCASMIDLSGKYAGVLRAGTPRGDVLRELPPAVSSGVMADETEVDRFHVRGKVSDLPSAEVDGMLSGCSFFLWELYAFPKALWHLPRQMRGTHEVAVYYTNECVCNYTLRELEKE